MSRDATRDLASAALSGRLSEAFAQILEEDDPAPDPGEEASARYSAASDDSLVDFVEIELGVSLRNVPVLLSAFLAVVRAARQKQIIRLALLGPRGGGKTRFAASIELVLYRFFAYDCQNIGGSLKQAQQCYEYVVDGHRRSSVLREFTSRQLMRETRAVSGETIQISAASDTSIRGPHPGGPTRGGLVVIDEVAIIKDALVDAAKGQLTSANPSACVQLSTMGERQTGRWMELIADEKHKGYDLRRWDIFDVARRCPYDCATSCPVPDHFARDHEFDLPGGGRQFVHKAYCGGKAHEVDGWVSIDEIAQQWDEMPRSSFERECMGIDTAVVGKVFDPLLLTAASPQNVSLGDTEARHAENLRRVEKAVGIDWGWSGATAACFMLRLKHTLLVYRWGIWSHESFGKIGRAIVDACLEERVGEILPDGAQPSDNDALREYADLECERLRKRTGEEFGIGVRPVAFGEWKAYGFGEVNRRLERKLLVLPQRFGGKPVIFYDRAMAMIRSHQKGEDGRPMKKDDHCSDAAMCGVLNWSGRWRGNPRVG